jgi:hypothetical protein
MVYNVIISKPGATMSFLKSSLLSMLLLSFSLPVAFAQTIGDEVIEDIQSQDIGPVQKKVKEITGTDIEITADWSTFKNASYNAAQELGADIQMLPSTFSKLMEDKEAAPLVKKNVKKFQFKNDKNAKKPTVSFKKGTITLNGNFLVMNWSAAEKGLSAMIKDQLNKK